MPKTSSNDVTGVALAAWGVLPSDKGKLEKLGTHGVWQKM